MVEFICRECNFSTDKKSNYYRHRKTKKHLNKVTQKCKPPVQKKKIKCTYCNTEFVHMSSYSRHIKSCEKKVSFTKDYDKIKEENLELRKEIIRLMQVLKPTSNTFNIIQNNFINAPPLETLENVREIPAIKDIHDREGSLGLCDTLRYHKQHNTLHKYIGDIVVGIHKKDNPHDQSMWSTDTSRLTYAVREIFDKIPEWKKDKKGLIVQDKVVEPIIEHLEDIIRTESDGYIKYVSKRKGPTSAIKQATCLNEILNDIEDGKLKKDILKYMAPFFVMKVKEDNIPKLTVRTETLTTTDYSDYYSDSD